MKFIHTADWHMSNSFLYGASEVDGVSIRLMDSYHRIKKLVDFAIAKKVDFVVHAGDVSDSSNPSEVVRRYFVKAILPLLLNNIRFVVIAGNHDLQFGKHWLTSMGLIENNNLIVIERPEVIKLSRSTFIYAVPYGSYDMLFTIKEYFAASGFAGDKVFNILLTHLGVREGLIGANEIKLKAEAECKLLRGNYKYVALGHYHRKQSWGNIHYSGSLLRSDFSERKEKKGFIYYKDGKTRFVVLPDRRFVYLTNKHFKVIVSKKFRSFRRFLFKEEFTSLVCGSVIKIRLLVSSAMFKRINVIELGEQLYGLGAVKVLYDWNIDLGNSNDKKSCSGDFNFIDYDKAIRRYCLKNGIRDKEFINQGRQIWREALQGFGE